MTGIHLLPEIDFSQYTARGFSEEHDANIAASVVAGDDLAHALGMVRICAVTERAIYEGEFSPRHICYHKGSRPVLETIVQHGGINPDVETVVTLMGWVHQNVRHAWTSEVVLPPDRNFTEEEIISSGTGWCNEQARVFIGLCEVLELPARLCFVFHQDIPFGHAAAEVFLDNRWCFFDPTFDLHVKLPAGRVAKVTELAGPWRPLAHKCYQAAYQRFIPKIASRWRPRFFTTHNARPSMPADLLAFQGVTNYLITGVTAPNCPYHKSPDPNSLQRKIPIPSDL